MLDFVDPICELRKPTREFRKTLRFERGIHDDAAAFAECSAEGANELAPRIAAICGKKLVVLWLCARLSLHVD